MFIKQLILNNFGPFLGEQKVDFSESDNIIFIQGIYDRNDKESNRAGKSSFLDSVLYLLFGEARDKEVKLIHGNEDEMWVYGKFIINDTEISIKRGRTRSNKPILEIEGFTEHTKADKEKLLGELIGLSYNDFLNTNYFMQNNFHGFMNSSPSDRKKCLQQWLNLEHWNSYYEKAKVKYAKLKDELQVLEINRQSTESQITSIIIEDTQSINEEIEKRKISNQESNNRLIQYKIDISNTTDPSELIKSLEKLKKEVSSYEVNITNTTSQLTSLSNQQQTSLKYKQEAVKLKAELTTPSDSLITSLDAEKKKLTPILSEISILQANLKARSALLKQTCSFTGICPIDSKECDKGNRIPEFNDNLKKDIESIEKSINDLSNNKYLFEKEITNLEKEYKRIKALEIGLNSLENSPDPTCYDETIKTCKDTLKLSQDKKEELNTQLLNLQEQIKNFDQVKRQELENKIKEEEKFQVTIGNRISELYNKIGQIKQKVENKNKLVEGIAIITNQIVSKKKDVHRWGYITSILGKDGIPSILIENNLSYIEDFANMLLDSVSKGYKIEFQTQRELTSKESTCSICSAPFGQSNNCESCGYGIKRHKIKDEIDMKIFNGIQEISFACDSGGGQILISLALRLALSNLLSTKTTKKCHLLILDEILGALDLVNREVVSKLIFNTLKNIMGFKQIFIVSHTEINDYNYKKIKIMRNTTENFSTIIS